MLSFIIFTLFATSHLVFSQEPKNEFIGGLPYYEIRLSKKDHKFFVIPPGPCSCNGGVPQLKCTKNLKKELEAQLSLKKISDLKKCAPNAGCVNGQETVFKECH